ncbi:hypothetical protein ACJ6WF_01760 [Streptomyces sp. MMS24-I2-30]
MRTLHLEWNERRAALLDHRADAAFRSSAQDCRTDPGPTGPAGT